MRILSDEVDDYVVSLASLNDHLTTVYDMSSYRIDVCCF